MAQNVTIQGTTYNSVPSVEIPKSGGGTASFTDVADTTATASDVASGKYFYTAAGVKTQGSASGGGGGAIEEYTPTWASFVSAAVGTIVSDGHYATLTARTDFSSSSSSNRIIGTIPSDVAPAGYYPFRVSHGGTSTIGSGYVDPSGNIYMKFNYSYANFTVTWAIAETSTTITYDTSVFSDLTGQIAVSGDFAEFAGYFTLKSGIAAGWKIGCITIPSAIRPSSNIELATIYASWFSGRYADNLYDASTGAVHIYIDRSVGATMYVKATWKIPN